MSQSERVLQGYLTQGTQSIVIGEDDNNVKFFDMFRQGVELKSNANLTNFISAKIRVNSEPVLIKNNKNETFDYFDDSLQDFGSSLDNSQQISYVFNHEIEKRDLGQIELSEKEFGPFIDNNLLIEKLLTVNLDPVFENKVNFSGLPLDGFIEPLMIRSEAEKSHPEFPFLSKGIRASIGQIEDTFRKSDLIEVGYNFPKNLSEVYDLLSQYYLDAVEFFGPVNLMPVFAEDNRKIIPFIDFNNDRELLYSKSTIDPEIVEVLNNPEYTLDNDENYLKFDAMGKTGWDFNEVGYRAVDSIVYGGLLKG
jgi:hypothetical protein